LLIADTVYVPHQPFDIRWLGIIRTSSISKEIYGILLHNIASDKNHFGDQRSNTRYSCNRQPIL
ncbi:hypothetical protein ACFLX7_02140, partial [Chloroflexota bacterium]